MKVFFTISLALSSIATAFNAVMSQDSTKFLVFETSYISESLTNLHGGIKKGSTYQGMIDLMATFDTEASSLWKGGTLYIHLENTHGGTPSQTYIGDYQVASNIENGSYTYLYQLWYNQNIYNFSFLVGLHDLNSEFLVTEYGGEYVNSSFGIMPSISTNIPVSIFPKTTLGAIVRYQASDYLSFQTAIYDGDPMCLDTDPYLKNFSISAKEGFIALCETHVKTLRSENFPGKLKVGGYFHSANYNSVKYPLNDLSGNYGAYFIIDQIIKPFNNYKIRSFGLFAYGGWAPSDRNKANFSTGLGLNVMAPLNNRPNDTFGIALAFVNVNKVNNDYTLIPLNESTIECMYKLKFNENIFIQPEIQYIINPGAEGELDNATVGLLRAYFEF